MINLVIVVVFFVGIFPHNCYTVHKLVVTRIVTRICLYNKNIVLLHN